VTKGNVQAVILAAGKGTRMKSARAKVLHPVLGVPLVEHVVRAVRALQPDPLILVVGHQANEVTAAFAGRGLDFVRQDPPLGTGHALLAARERLAAHPHRTVLVVNGDVPLLRTETLEVLIAAHHMAEVAATLITMRSQEPGAYGRVVRGPEGTVQAIVEARDATPEVLKIDEVNAGIYAFEVPPLLGALEQLLPQNAQGEYYATDLVRHLQAAGHVVAALAAENPRETIGVNTMSELAEAARLLRRRRNETLMAAGASLEDPETIHIGLDVTVAPDATILPFTILEGKTTIAPGARVGPYARLVDTRVGAGAQVLDHCLLRGCVVEAGASVGPFAHIRPESHIGPRAKVGNFVELKKTELGEGSKAPHLSYIGDATVGPGVNIGAGTITCNYDGTVKHPTRIEAGAFIGSNTTLVAPVEVGPGAYVAAGSTITKNVAAGALALGRAIQVDKPGWVEARKKAAVKARESAAAAAAGETPADEAKR
jgi:bifunctional UDP-N-acetylglucosamine pyrophosphorylase / glucosamine-1-phosphate N-acetyltransferase